jgi:hypothetical protein
MMFLIFFMRDEKIAYLCPFFCDLQVGPLALFFRTLFSLGFFLLNSVNTGMLARQDKYLSEYPLNFLAHRRALILIKPITTGIEG